MTEFDDSRGVIHKAGSHERLGAIVLAGMKEEGIPLRRSCSTSGTGPKLLELLHRLSENQIDFLRIVEKCGQL